MRTLYIYPINKITCMRSIESPRGGQAKSNGSCIVSIECAETRTKENKAALADIARGRRKRYWRGTGGYTCVNNEIARQRQSKQIICKWPDTSCLHSKVRACNRNSFESTYVHAIETTHFIRKYVCARQAVS